MILLKIKLDNIYAFKDFEMDMTYPKSIVNNPLGNEVLKNTNIRYNKVNIIMGPNASGKSTFGCALMNTFFFLSNFRKDTEEVITDMIFDKSKEAYIMIDIVTSQKKKLSRIEIKIEGGKNVTLQHSSAPIKSSSTYRSLVSALKIQTTFEKSVEYYGRMRLFDGWNFVFPILSGGLNDGRVNHYIENDQEKKHAYGKILFNVLKTLDPAIDSVLESNEIRDAYIVNIGKGIDSTAIENNASLSKILKLSTGTIHGIPLARTILSIMYHENRFYFVDEQFAYASSSFEKAILSLLISLLEDDEQLFFTTHNTDICSMRLPLHAFTFFTKNIVNGAPKISAINAQSAEKRNNVFVRNLLVNNKFGSFPDLSPIFELEKLK